MTSQWPDNSDAITWIVISNIFIRGDIHGRSCKKQQCCTKPSCWALCSLPAISTLTLSSCVLDVPDLELLCPWCSWPLAPVSLMFLTLSSCVLDVPDLELLCPWCSWPWAPVSWMFLTLSSCVLDVPDLELLCPGCSWPWAPVSWMFLLGLAWPGQVSMYYTCILREKPRISNFEGNIILCWTDDWLHMFQSSIAKETIERREMMSIARVQDDR